MNALPDNSENIDINDIIKNARENSQTALNEIKNFLNEYDTKTILMYISKIAFFISNNEQENQRGILYKLREQPIVQLLGGLSMQIESTEDKPEATSMDIYDVLNKASLYLTMDSISNGLNSEDTRKSMLIESHKRMIKNLRPVNPERYPFQTEYFVNYLDDKISDLFVKKCRLSPKEILNIGKIINDYTLNKVNNATNERLNHPKIQEFLYNPENDENFIKYLDNLKEEDKHDYLNFHVRYLDALACRDSLLFSADELSLNTKLEKEKINDYLLLCSSSTEDHKTSEDILVDNLLLSRPFIRYNDDYFCFIPPNVTSTLPTLFETIFEDEKIALPPTKAWDRYQKAKGHFVEDKAEEFFSRIFPKGSIYKNVIYTFRGNVEEADLLIHYGHKLIVVQAKSGSINKAARRGAEKSFKNTLKKLIEDAYNQCVMVREYIENVSDAKFFYQQNKSFAFSPVTDTDNKIDYIFLNLTLEPMGVLAARIKDLQSIGLFQRNEYPISMSIYDLDIITDTLPKTPSILIHYFKERLKSQEKGKYYFQDELTQLGLFLEHGAINIAGSFDEEEFTHITFDNDYLDVFDNHYLETRGNLPIDIKNDWLNLVAYIDRKSLPFNDELTEKLLNIKPQHQDRIIDRFKTTFDKKMKSGIVGSAVIAFEDEEIGMSFITSKNDVNKMKKMLESYSSVQKYKSKKRYWVGLAKIKKSNGPWWKITSVFYYDFLWEFDLYLDSVKDVYSKSSK